MADCYNSVRICLRVLLHPPGSRCEWHGAVFPVLWRLLSCPPYPHVFSVEDAFSGAETRQSLKLISEGEQSFLVTVGEGDGQTVQGCPGAEREICSSGSPLPSTPPSPPCGSFDQGEEA